MKKLITFFLIVSSVQAAHLKPELLARFSDQNAWNTPDLHFCFSSDPLVTSKAVYLHCRNSEGAVMMQWAPQVSTLARSPYGLFSHPLAIGDKVTWHEFDEVGVTRLFTQENNQLTEVKLNHLGERFSNNDSFLPILGNSWIYRSFNQEHSLWIWKNHQTQIFFHPSAAHIFPPITSSEGTLAVKIREESRDESSPDKLLLWDGEWKEILQDRDADSSSAFLSFRHQMGVDGKKVVFVAKDATGEVLLLWENNKLRELARVGEEIKSFDFFAPKVSGDLVVFRGLDTANRKTIWVSQQGELRRLLTQGDPVHTDLGWARVDYKSQDSLFWGSPAIGPQGDIVLQATLTDINHSNTLLGIGLLRFKRE